MSSWLGLPGVDDRIRGRNDVVHCPHDSEGVGRYSAQGRNRDSGHRRTLRWRHENPPMQTIRYNDGSSRAMQSVFLGPQAPAVRGRRTRPGRDRARHDPALAAGRGRGVRGSHADRVARVLGATLDRAALRAGPAPCELRAVRDRGSRAAALQTATNDSNYMQSQVFADRRCDTP
jgi:hypothetical protein